MIETMNFENITCGKGKKQCVCVSIHILSYLNIYFGLFVLFVFYCLFFLFSHNLHLSPHIHKCTHTHKHTHTHSRVCVHAFTLLLYHQHVPVIFHQLLYILMQVGKFEKIVDTLYLVFDYQAVYFNTIE